MAVRRALLSSRPTHTLPSLRSTRPTIARYLSTTSTPTPGASSKTPRRWPLALALILSGTLGAYTAHSLDTDTTFLPRTWNPFSPARPSPESRVSGLNNLYGSTSDFSLAIQELKDALGKTEEGEGEWKGLEKVSTDEEELERHGFSENDYHPGSSPTVIVYPTSTEDVVKIVNISREHLMPLVCYSGATSLEGHFRAPSVGAICVDMSRMDRILEIHEADSDLVCQPGARWMDINSTLQKRGVPLFFPIDPAPGATIGGMVSTGCSGTNAVRYGTAKGEWFLNLTVVLPSGKIIKTRRRSRKSSAGWDTTKLFVGAEGTLGVITEVTIRLAPRLPTTVAVAQFPDVRRATEAVIEVMNQGVGIQCVELCDDQFMLATNLHGLSSRTHPWPVLDSLFFKFQGPTALSLSESAAITERICKKHGSTGFELAGSEREAEEVWMDRKNALYSGLALGEGREGVRGWSTDVCVPVSRLPDLVYETKRDVDGSGLVSTIVGHVGDGNFHALLLFSTDEELEIAKGLVHRMVERAIALDGTCTGEHGVGIGKRQYLYDELGEGTVELMKSIKRTLDPYNLFNPGKLYPDRPGSGSGSREVYKYTGNDRPSESREMEVEKKEESREMEVERKKKGLVVSTGAGVEGSESG